MIALQVEGQELASLSKYEWLETNGLGGFASSTITGLNTRRYHGLLIAATKPPVGRVVLLSKVEETVVISGARHELSCNSYPGAVHPQGFRYLKSFWLDPFPISQFKVNDVVIEKSIFMRYGENTTVVQYQVVDWGTQQEITLELRPLIAFRDFHSLTRENGALNGMLGNPQSGVVTIQPYSGLPALRFAYGDGYVGGESCWYRNFDYDAELQRGLDFREDLFCPFTLYFKLDRRRPTATIIASLENHFATDADLMRRTEIQRRNAITAHGQSESERLLLSAADQYIVKRGNQHTVIAGYHWFSDWGRDTMISLPGLTLSIGRYDIAKDILLTFAESVSQGMLPNRFPDAGEAPEYNTVDATLWFFHAIGEYARHTGDHEFVRLRLYPVLKEIIDWHIRGTRHGIRMDEDALLLSGESGVQLTWMDAKVGDWVVTPRHGKPVEIQALWYNALCVMQSLATRFKDSDAMQYQTLSARVIASFNAQFWNAERGCLYDVISTSGADGAVRPNQIFAISLPNQLLDRERAFAVLGVVEKELLTPYGLRSLSPSDPAYRKSYSGGVFSRDSAYHQGTVWPWLMGPFISAYLKVHRNQPDAIASAREWLRALEQHLLGAGLGHASEVFDAEEPYHPGGCIAQAWSAAEMLRATREIDAAVSPRLARTQTA